MIRPVTSADRAVLRELLAEFYDTDAVLHPLPASYHDAALDELFRSDSLQRACLLEHIRKYNVKVHTHTKLTKVGEGTVYAEEYGEPITFKRIDMLVNAMGVRSYNPLQEQLAGLDCKVVVVGDASSTKNGYKNIREGFNAGNAI